MGKIINIKVCTTCWEQLEDRYKTQYLKNDLRNNDTECKTCAFEEKLFSVVTNIFGLTMRQLKSKNQEHKLVEARCVIWYYLKDKRKRAYLANLFNKDIATVSSSHKRAIILSKDKEFSKILRTIDKIMYPEKHISEPEPTISINDCADMIINLPIGKAIQKMKVELTGEDADSPIEGNLVVVFREMEVIKAEGDYACLLKRVWHDCDIHIGSHEGCGNCKHFKQM